MAKRKKRRAGKQARRSPHAEATSICDSCGEEIVVPVDISAGVRGPIVLSLGRPRPPAAL
jgi:hypothetical protein